MTRKKQIFVDLWRGCDYALDTASRRIFFDHCLTPGEIFNLPMKEYFGCTMKKMLPLGYPHYDEILRDSPEALQLKESLLKKSGSSKLLLWIPCENKKLTEEEIRHLDDLCGKKGIHLLVNTQILEADSETGLLKWGRENHTELTNISQYTEEIKKTGVDIYKILHVADALISDYSSCMADFLLLDRPIATDIIKLSEQKRWIFDDYPEFMPGKKVFSFDDICEFVEEVSEGRDEKASERRQAADRIFDRCDNYCQRIADCIFEEGRGCK